MKPPFLQEEYLTSTCFPLTFLYAEPSTLRYRPLMNRNYGIQCYLIIDIHRIRSPAYHDWRQTQGNQRYLLFLAVQISEEVVAEALAGVVEAQLLVDAGDFLEVLGIQLKVTF
jgi:hypothetical protein